MEKLCHKSNTIKFEAKGVPIIKLYGMENISMLDSTSIPHTPFIYNSIVNNAELLTGGVDNPNVSSYKNIMGMMDTSTFTYMVSTSTFLTILIVNGAALSMGR